MLPEKPATLPADAYFVWPFGMDLGGLKLRFATAQPLAKVGTAKEPVYVFFAQPGIPPEFVVEDAAGLKVERTMGSPTVTRRDGAIWLNVGISGPTAKMRFTLADGRTVRLIVLGQGNVEKAWKVSSGEETELLVTSQPTDQVFVDGGLVTLQRMSTGNFVAFLLPGDDAKLVSVDPGVRIAETSLGLYVGPLRTTLRSSDVMLEAKQTKPAGEVAPLPADFKPSGRPRVVAAAPTDADWSRAATWTFTLPKNEPAAGEKRFLRIKYVGDVMRLSAGGKLLDDNFADGRPWLVGLTRFAPELEKNELQLSIYPLRKDAPIFFEPGLEPKVEGAQVDELESVVLVTQYSLKLKLEAAATKR
jgi:hypothetical protein